MSSSRNLLILGVAIIITILSTTAMYIAVSPLSEKLSQLSASIYSLNEKISSLNTTVSSRLYIHSRLLRQPTTTIQGNSKVEGWILEWTPDRDIRILKIQVWMGNPSGVEWEGDTFVTLGKPNDPWNPETDQLLVHYQFDSHAPSPIPHQLMFDLSYGFKVTSGQTINIFRLFVNINSNPVNAGDIEVIFYYIYD